MSLYRKRAIIRPSKGWANSRLKKFAAEGEICTCPFRCSLIDVAVIAEQNPVRKRRKIQ